MASMSYTSSSHGSLLNCVICTVMTSTEELMGNNTMNALYRYLTPSGCPFSAQMLVQQLWSNTLVMLTMVQGMVIKVNDWMVIRMDHCIYAPPFL